MRFPRHGACAPRRGHLFVPECGFVLVCYRSYAMGQPHAWYNTAHHHDAEYRWPSRFISGFERDKGVRDRRGGSRQTGFQTDDGVPDRRQGSTWTPGFQKDDMVNRQNNKVPDGPRGSIQREENKPHNDFDPRGLCTKYQYDKCHKFPLNDPFIHTAIAILIYHEMSAFVSPVLECVTL